MKRLTGLDWPILTAAACLLALTIAGATVTDMNSHDNTIINAGGVALSSGQKKATTGVVSLNVCGTQIVGQGSHVTVSKGAC